MPASRRPQLVRETDGISCMQAANFARNRILRSAAVSQKSYLKKTKYSWAIAPFSAISYLPSIRFWLVFFFIIFVFIDQFFFQVRTCVVQLVTPSASAKRRALEC